MYIHVPSLYRYYYYNYACTRSTILNITDICNINHLMLIDIILVIDNY